MVLKEAQRTDGTFTCCVSGCEAEFSEEMHLSEHLRVDHGFSKSPLPSETTVVYCDTDGQFPRALLYHSRLGTYNPTSTGNITGAGGAKRRSRYSKEKPITCPFKNCDRTFYHYPSLYRHKKIHHTN